MNRRSFLRALGAALLSDCLAAALSGCLMAYPAYFTGMVKFEDGIPVSTNVCMVNNAGASASVAYKAVKKGTENGASVYEELESSTILDAGTHDYWTVDEISPVPGFTGTIVYSTYGCHIYE